MIGDLALCRRLLHFKPLVVQSLKQILEYRIFGGHHLREDGGLRVMLGAFQYILMVFEGRV